MTTTELRIESASLAKKASDLASDAGRMVREAEQVNRNMSELVERTKAEVAELKALDAGPIIFKRPLTTVPPETVVKTVTQKEVDKMTGKGRPKVYDDVLRHFGIDEE